MTHSALLPNVPDRVQDFLFHCRFERSLATKTLKAYKTDLRQFQDWLGNVHPRPLDQVDRDVLRDWLRYLLQEFKSRTVRRKVAVIKALFAHLEIEGTIEANPFRRMRVDVKMEKILPRSIPMSEIRKLFGHLYQAKASDPARRCLTRDLAVLEFLFVTGVRVSEASSLRRADVDIEGGWARVIGKGNRERILPLCDNDAIEALREYSARYGAEIKASGVFFVNRDGNQLSAQSIRFMLNRYANAAGLSLHVTPHMLRHTLATELVANGADTRHVQYLLGHSSIITTQIYTHVDVDSSRRVLADKHPRQSLSRKEEPALQDN